MEIGKLSKSDLAAVAGSRFAVGRAKRYVWFFLVPIVVGVVGLLVSGSLWFSPFLFFGVAFAYRETWLQGKFVKKFVAANYKEDGGHGIFSEAK